MLPFADLYTFRARIQPALAVALPLGFLMFALLPGHHFFVTAFFGLLGAAGGTAVLAQVGRDRGSRKQDELWESWGGAPTTRLLRHRHIPGDPESADARYREVTLALQGATRDRSRFELVFAENVNYGFRRNMWGLKPWGLPMALALALVAWALFVLTVWGRSWPDPWWNVLV